MRIAVRLILGALVCLVAGPLYAQGTINDLPRNETLIAELKGIEVPTLPELESEQVVLSGRGYSSAYLLLDAYSRCIQNLFLCYQYHFEMLLLAYVAQLNFQDLCKSTLPMRRSSTVTEIIFSRRSPIWSTMP